MLFQSTERAAADAFRSRALKMKWEEKNNIKIMTQTNTYRLTGPKAVLDITLEDHLQENPIRIPEYGYRINSFCILVTS